MKLQPRTGRWSVETAKNIRLYIVDVDKFGHVHMAYQPGQPIAVVATPEDFKIFFEVVPKDRAPPLFLVKEREFTRLSRPLAYRNKSVAQFTPWKTIGRFLTFEEARIARNARNTGLFERVVIYRSMTLLDAQGELRACGPPGHIRGCRGECLHREQGKSP